MDLTWWHGAPTADPLLPAGSNSCAGRGVRGVAFSPDRACANIRPREPRTREPRTKELRTKELRIKELRIKELRPPRNSPPGGTQAPRNSGPGDTGAGEYRPREFRPREFPPCDRAAVGQRDVRPPLGPASRMTR